MPRRARPENTSVPMFYSPASEPLAEEDDETVYPLTGALNERLEAIVSGCALMANLDVLGSDPSVVEAAADEDLADTLALSMQAAIEGFAGISVATRVLVTELFTEVLGRGPVTPVPGSAPDVKSGEPSAYVDALGALTRQLLPESVPVPLRPNRAERREALMDAATLIREVGLEEFDVSCELLTSGNEAPRLWVSPRSPESAHVILLEFLFDRAEAMTRTADPLLDLEREASAWEFERWSVAPPPGWLAAEVAAFSRDVREQEYSLAERRTVALGRSVMQEIADDAEFGKVHPRQRRLAAALTGSIVGVFECVALDGHRATFRSVQDGQTYDVHEHMNPIEYSPGWVGAGRLLPFEGKRFLRSPGMVFFDPDTPEMLAPAVNALDDLRAVMPDGLALEAFIAGLLGISVPRAVKPAASRAEARDLVQMLEMTLDDAELERAEEREEPIELDGTLTAFLAALENQATAGATSVGRRQARKKKRKAVKKRKKRR